MARTAKAGAVAAVPGHVAPGTVRVSRSNQDVNYLELLRLSANAEPTPLPVHRLRIRIRSNAYKFQSHATIERWTGEKWTEVYTIDSGSMVTPEGLYARREDGDDRRHFTVDRLELIARAAEVLL